VLLYSSKIASNKWGFSRFHAILVTKNWSLSDQDPKLIFLDPDPANYSGSYRRGGRESGGVAGSQDGWWGGWHNSRNTGADESDEVVGKSE